jgi:cellulose synthase/poly-beta-1,6-N-acetylglucosamine synthase-like glycosyltransferase
MAFGNLLIYSAVFMGLYTTIFFLLTILENRHHLYRPKLQKNFPSVSIIVPCYNEEKSIAQTIESLLALDYPHKKLDILVIDDGSKDKTFKVAKQFEKGGIVKVYHKENGGKYTALNYGLARIKTEFVGTLDADSFVGPQSLKTMLPFFSETNVQAVTSSLKIYQPKTVFQYLQNIEYTFGIFLRKTLSFMGSIKVTPGPLTLFRRSVFEKIGYYRKAHQTEDLEIGFRLQSHNFQIENAVDAHVYTVAPASFKPLYKQRVRWYQGLLRNGWDYRRLLSFQHGNLGLFILPVTYLGLFSLLSVSGLILAQIVTKVSNAFISWQAIGFDISQLHFHFDWFFLNSHLLIFLGLLSAVFTVIAIFMGQKLSKSVFSIDFSKGIILAALFYGPLYLSWWLGATTQVLLNRHPNWVKEKEVI